MAERIQKSKSQQKREETVQEEVKTDAKEELKDDLDALLDEIDEVLEENAQEFVRNYIQKGGQLSEVLLSAWYNIRDGCRQTQLYLLGVFFNGNMRGGWLQ